MASWLCFALLFAASLSLVSSLPPSLNPTTIIEEKRTNYIVRVQHDLKPSVFPTHQHWYESTLLTVRGTTPSDPSITTASTIHVYSTVFHGFSAKLTATEAQALESLPAVLAVLPDRVRHLHTTRSPQFLGLKIRDESGLLAESDFGADLVVAVLDTGISPESLSFSDKGLGPVPARWRGRCEAGRGFPASSCNRKIVGARFFCGGYEAMAGAMNQSVEFRSPRDSDGHGTHTASIAAGRYVFEASMLGFARGVAAGMAPKARIAAYKVCWTSGCFDSDILSAFDQAVSDGADVISLSVGGGVVPYYLDAIAIGAFGAVERGIFVSASAGNEGPGEMTVTNVSPWITTVGAGSMDRTFPADVLLGNGRTIPGVSLYAGGGLPVGRFLPLVYAGNAPISDDGSDGYSSSLCMEGSLNPKAVRGKIVLCDRGSNPRVEKGAVVGRAGGLGMILANGASDGEGLVADSHVIPATSVGATAGEYIREYINSARKPTATIVFRGTQLGVRPAPVLASFSARGPNPETPDLLKPDVIAPGLNILAAWPDGVGPSGVASDRRRTQFNILSGTSMACPHVSGLAALLKGANPGWSPAAIRSALMTTAYTMDSRNETMLDEATGNASTVLGFGAGHVDPQRALDPGLVYDLTVDDYVAFLCSSNYSDKSVLTVARRTESCGSHRRLGGPGDLNYPSISAVFQMDGSGALTKRVARTVTNVGAGGRTVYRATVRPPRGSTIRVVPETLEFLRSGQTARFELTVGVSPVRMSPGSSRVESGMLTWSDGRHVVSSPIVVTWQAPY
ncbi:subtilisin-like protease SBT1.5 [Nymphaea colorata]|nr:subtilisin-like protease SBT1.5 [Nymphaea colorata]